MLGKASYDVKRQLKKTFSYLIYWSKSIYKRTGLSVDKAYD